MIPCHFQKSKFSLRKTSRSRFLAVKLARLAVRILELKENKRSTAAELGNGVLCLINKLVQSCRYTAGKLQGESESCSFFLCSSGLFLPLVFLRFDRDLVESLIPTNKKIHTVIALCILWHLIKANFPIRARQVVHNDTFNLFFVVVVVVVLWWITSFPNVTSERGDT